jgi:hypothetical protein
MSGRAWNHASAMTRGRLLRRLAPAALVAAGCEPILDIEGSFFPAWMLCIAVGIVLAIAARRLLAALGLEPYLGPLVLVYPSLALLLTLAVWLVFFKA